MVKFTSDFPQGMDRRQMMMGKDSSSDESIFPLMDDYEEQDEALLSVNNFGCDDLASSQQAIEPFARPRVHFAHQDTIIYHQDNLTQEETNGCWYKQQDYSRFIHQTAKHANVILSMETISSDPFFWSKNLRRIHEAFRSHDNVKHSAMLLQSNRISVDERFVGMECRAVPSIMKDFFNRRQMLLTEIKHWQQTPAIDNETRIFKIRASSEKRSRVSVKYAHYIAKVNARPRRNTSHSDMMNLSSSFHSI